MHARAIHNDLTQGRTVRKGGSNPPNPPAYPGSTLDSLNMSSVPRLLVYFAAFKNSSITVNVWYTSLEVFRKAMNSRFL